MLPQVANPDNYRFGVLAWSALAVGLSIAGLGLFVLARERFSRIGGSFCFLCLSVSWYLVFSSLNYASQAVDPALLWSRFCSLGAVFIPCSILLLPAMKFDLSSRFRPVIAASAVLSFLFGLSVFFTDLYLTGIRRFAWGFFGQYGPLGYLFLCYFFSAMVFSLRLYWLAYRDCRTLRQKKRFWGLLIGFIGGYLGSVDFLPAFGIGFPPLGFLPISFFIAMSAYVVVRYRLVDITPELAAGQILETMHGAVILTGIDGAIRVVNPVAEELLGLPHTMLIGRDLAAVIPVPADMVADTLVGARPEPLQLALPGGSGRRLVSLSASLLREKGDAEPLGVVYVMYDITAHLAAEDALQKSEELYRGVVENIGIGISVIGPDMRILSLNRQMQEWFPRIDAATSPVCFHAFNDPPRDSVCSYCPTVQTLGDGRIHEAVTATPHHGGIVNYRVKSSPIKDKEGRVVAAIEMVEEITERKKAEDALRAKDIQLQGVLEATADGILAVDSSGRVIVANRRFAELWNIPQEIIDTADDERMLQFVLDQLVSSDQFLARVRTLYGSRERDRDTLLFKNGRVFDRYSMPLLHGDALIGRVWSFRDITERRLLEEERLKTQKLEAIGTLAGGIAHDFNNLLQGVFGYISIAQLTNGDVEKCGEALKEAEQALNLSVNLTSQLLTFAKGGKPVKKVIDIVPLIQKAANFSLSGSRSTCRFRAAEGLWRIEADDGQMNQVIQNVVLNADQAMPDGGTIEISARNVEAPGEGLPQGLAAGRFVEISVRDSGVGIPAENITRIFDPYFSTKKKGCGLGLATSYSIMRSHGGLIAVQSGPEKGTTFFLYAPAVAADRQAAAVPTTAPAAAGRRGRILVMDDEKLVLDTSAALFRALGHEVLCASNGAEAVERFEAAERQGAPFDIVILDLTIKGGMGGVETLRILRERDPAVRAVVSSGYSDDAVMANFREHGFKAALRKPYTVAGLRQMLGEVLERT